MPDRNKAQPTTDGEISESEESSTSENIPQSTRLFRAFQARQIRLRLHGVRLPPEYTISLRLSSRNDRITQPAKPKRRRRWKDSPRLVKADVMATTDNDSEPSLNSGANQLEEVNIASAAAASDDEQDASIRANNAYTGSLNTIGSVHQRNWFLTLDRTRSGFRKTRTSLGRSHWVGPWEPFFVRGRDHERSIITGRLSDDVMMDAAVESFVGRKMWIPIME